MAACILHFWFAKLFLRGSIEETVGVLQLHVQSAARNCTSLFTTEIPIE